MSDAIQKSNVLPFVRHGRTASNTFERPVCPLETAEGDLEFSVGLLHGAGNFAVEADLDSSPLQAWTARTKGASDRHLIVVDRKTFKPKFV